MKKTLYLLLFLLISSISVEAQKLTIGSFNIRYDNSDDASRGDAWTQRYPVQCQLIQFNDFDVIGLQEVLHHQLNDLRANLPEYNYIGVGRNDGKTEGEYAPIFYKKDKIDILKSGHFWLSEDMTKPNTGWDASQPRICTWSQLEEKESKQKFWFFNLHMDHIGVVARRESAKLVLNKIQEMCENDPVILVGDFNVDQTNESYTLLNTSEILNDSYEIAEFRYALNGTFNAFDINLKTESRIDHIFVSPSFIVERYGILTDTYRSEIENSETIQTVNFPKEVSLQQYQARLPSDHYPVKVILRYKD